TNRAASAPISKTAEFRVVVLGDRDEMVVAPGKQPRQPSASTSICSNPNELNNHSLWLRRIRRESFAFHVCRFGQIDLVRPEAHRAAIFQDRCREAVFLERTDFGVGEPSHWTSLDSLVPA